jgi:hypothetical protein
MNCPHRDAKSRRIANRVVIFKDLLFTIDGSNVKDGGPP